MKKILLIIAALILILVVALTLFAGKIIKTGVNVMGPKLVGVPVSLSYVGLNPLTGVVHLKGLTIGNPEGFNTSSAMELGELKIDISMASLFSDTIVIKEILIDAPQITYEQGLRSSNLSTLQKNLSKEAAEQKSSDAEPTAKKGEAKKVVINDFQLNGATVNASITALGGRKMALKLPAIQLKDIGKKSGGTSPAEVISEVFGSITRAVTDLAAGAMSGAGNLATGVLKDTGGVASDAAKGAADSIKKGLGGLLGK